MILAFLLYVTLCYSAIPTVTSTAEILAKPLSLIYFHAFDCQYCRAFDPDIEFIAELFNDKNPSFQIVKVNGRSNADLVQQFQVSSFPTLKLYDNVKKEVTTFAQQRTVSNVVSFIEELTDLKPDYSQLVPKTFKVKDVGEFDELLTKSRKTVLVFVNEDGQAWRTHYYPGHFYQQLAAEHPDIQFAVKFVEEEDSSLMAKYHVSNFPSMIYFHGDGFTTFNTFSTNQLTNNDLECEHILSLIHGTIEADHFNSIAELAEAVESMKYEGHKQWKGGFNYIESRFSDYDGGQDLDDQFEQLLAAVALG